MHVPTGPYERALVQAERTQYQVPGATVPWILLPIAAPAVRIHQSLRIALQRRARRDRAALLWQSSENQALPAVGFGDVMLLRSFGNDGGITVAQPDDGSEPLENLIADVVQRLGYSNVFALGYRAKLRVPRGPRYCRVGDERWKTELGAALDACSAIIVLLHDSTEFRPGFAHELKLIRNSSTLSAKTVLVGSSLPTVAAYDVMSETLSHLRWRIPSSVPIACLRTSDGHLAAYFATEKQGQPQQEYRTALTKCLRFTPDFPEIFELSDGRQPEG